jgi:enterochelin esterase family protein
LRTELPTIVWNAPGVVDGEPVPALIVHDGLEYDAFSHLLLFLSKVVEGARLPPMRAVLIAPIERNQIYSASAVYSRALMYEILPTVARLAPTPHGRSMRVGMGASLGALALLHAHRMNPASFGALFLQSGSFFRQRYDKQESGFVRFRRISRFVGQVLNADDWPHPIPVAMTCGNIEENLANNRATEEALIRQGYEVSFFENRDGHNWIGWRDALDPHLIDVLNKAWSARI